MRKGLFYFIGWTYVVLGTPLLLIALLIRRLGRAELSASITQKYMSCLASLLLRLAGAKVTVEGKENLPDDLPVVFISSHQGHFDSAVILANIKVPMSFVATTNASKFPIISRWFDLGYTVYMERGNMRQNYEAIKQAEEVIKNGRSMVIYPEGIISNGPEIGEFKRGSFRLATNTGAAIVPLAIDGSWQIMGTENNTIQPADIVMRILPPVPTKGLSRQEIQELHQQVFELIKANLAEIQADGQRFRSFSSNHNQRHTISS